MKLTSTYLLLLFCLSCVLMSAQNLLDTSTWTVGSGSVSGFSQNGATNENIREFGTDPFGNSSILWKGGNDASSNADGGWNSSYHNIDHKETYRFVVWLKKTNSNNGRTYFGCQQWQSNTTLYSQTILKLDGSVNTSPYFWAGDLPQLNKWYMLVGYVHGSNYNSDLSFGGIYDPVTRTKVLNITDLKFASSTTKLRHRVYLYWDTNISDRQYFWNPRIELVDGNEPPIQELLGLNNDDDNLLDTSTWTVGCGSVAGFSRNGATSENCRELGENHVGDEVVLWKAIPDSAYNADGGWNSSYHNINYTKTYRFSVWIKKTNSNNGRTYFGCRSSKHVIIGTTNQNIKNLNGTTNTNPYFWYGDLPELNKWYLLIGYVHPYNYPNSSPSGGIYDGVTGKRITYIRDFKVASGTLDLSHRSYLYYDPNASDRQYFWNPRIDEITGNEPTTTELLQINEDSKLIFSYDLSGNQTQRFYCEEEGFCSPTAPSSRRIDERGVTMGEEQGVVVAEQTAVPLPGEEIQEETEELDVKYRIYPNPTDNKVTIQLSGKDYKLTNSISIYNTNGSLIRRIDINDPTNQMDLDLSNTPSGVYFIHLHFTNGTITTEQIIKN